MMNMLDYVALSSSRLREMRKHASELVAPLVEAYRTSECTALRIVACGSSRHAADCTRYAVQEVLRVPVVVVSPESFAAIEHVFPQNAFTIAVSQSGYSTNTLSALDFMRDRGMPGAALTAAVDAPIGDHADTVVDYGAGVESVDFVTMGVVTLIEFLMLFALETAGKEGRSFDDLAHYYTELDEAIEAHSLMVSRSLEFVRAHKLTLSEDVPAIIVGNGANFGVAEEAALKFNETLKIPAMFFEGEEFIHGPEMQITPGYRVFIVDDPAGSDRLAGIAEALSQVTDGLYFLTAHPRGRAYEVPTPRVSEPFSALPNLVLFQTIAAFVAQELNSWDVHPYLDAVASQLEAKAPGYEESVRRLEAAAVAQYQTTAGT